jgi:hypothetical protein
MNVEVPRVGRSCVLGGDMANRLAQALDALDREQEAPIYVLERLRGAVSEDCQITSKDARRLRALDKSGAGRAFGSGWMDFLAYAMTVRKAV